MATSDIALEKVQALLKVDSGGGSLYNHLVSVIRTLAAEKPADALGQLEALSRYLKLAGHRGALAPDAAEDAVLDAAAESLRQSWCAQALNLARPTDITATPQVLGAVQNFLEDASMFEWAGVGFGRQESYHIAMSLRKLAASTPALERLRLWGKVLGAEGDYYVAEGSLKIPADAATPAPLPGTPEYDVEPRGQGSNVFNYWVSAGGAAPWVRLGSARASHVVAARSIKRMMTGNLSSSVNCTPWFPGTEQHLLRAQIARITSTCTLAVKGWYEADDEAGKNKIKEVESPADAFPSHEDLRTQGGWVHASPYLLGSGRSVWPDMDTLEGQLSEDAIKELQQQAEAEPEHGMLESIEADLEDIKPEDGDGSPAWSIKVYGDQGIYQLGDAAKSYRVTAIRSLIWPGAITVAQGSRFANLYVGYGLKCGSLVPAQKDSGLPLRGTVPILPLAPADIMDEPQDLVEQEEPNPIQDEAQSDKGDVDEDPGN